MPSQGRCFTTNRESDGQYGVEKNKFGNSVLTGRGDPKENDDDKWFTCRNLEVYLVGPELPYERAEPQDKRPETVLTSVVEAPTTKDETPTKKDDCRLF